MNSSVGRIKCILSVARDSSATTQGVERAKAWILKASKNKDMSPQSPPFALPFPFPCLCLLCSPDALGFRG